MFCWETLGPYGFHFTCTTHTCVPPHGNGAMEWQWAPQHDNGPCLTTRTAQDLLGEHKKMPSPNLIQHLWNMPESIRIIGPKRSNTTAPVQETPQNTPGGLITMPWRVRAALDTFVWTCYYRLILFFFSFLCYITGCVYKFKIKYMGWTHAYF